MLASNDPHLMRLLQGAAKDLLSYYETDSAGRRHLTFLKAIENHGACHKCHGSTSAPRGIVKFTISMEWAEAEIRKTRQHTLLAAGLAVTAILLFTGYMLGRSVVSPIERMTEAMTSAAKGNLDRMVPVESSDELGQMASSFKSCAELRKTYTGLKPADKPPPSSRFYKHMVTTKRCTGDPRRAAARQTADTITPALNGRSRGALRLAETGCAGFPTTMRPDAATIPPETAAPSAARCGRNTGGGIATVRHRWPHGAFNRRPDQTRTRHARRYHLNLSVLMLDVDHFKRFNDEHGHEMGDQVLKVIAATLKGALRNHDVACRYGGEEFFAILPSTPQSGAYAVAERLRKDVEDVVIEGLKVTVSIGVATFPNVGLDSPEALAQAADGALYQAKNSGRNRVRVAEPLPAA